MVIRSVLNGIIGDYLEKSQNELAIDMAFYNNNGFPLDISNIDLNREDIKHNTLSKICILVHGLTDDESTWSFEKHEDIREDYGSFLQHDFGFSPFYLRYNTGLHISTNGRKLNSLMNSLFTSCTCSTTQECKIVFLCHSMGGLVTRSALHYGLKDNSSSWVSKVSSVVFLGTPHQGSHWEQLGNIVTNAIGSVPRPYMKLAETFANLRSDGIKDLRYGYVLDEDWQRVSEDDDNVDINQDSFLKNTKKKTNLPTWISYYTVTGTVTKNPNHPLSFFVGDALVRKSSAEGRSDNDDHHLDFPVENFAEFAGIGHCRLSNHSAVYEQIKVWIGRDNYKIHSQQEATDISSNGYDNYQQLATYKEKNRTWVQGKGVASLVEDAVDNGVRSIEHVHFELTDETFTIFSTIRVMPLQTIKVVHDAYVGGVYKIIRAVNNITSEIVKSIFICLDQNDDGKTTEGGF